MSWHERPSERLWLFADLYPAVPPVGDDDVAVGVDGDAGRRVELPVAFAVRAELEEELAVGAVHLRGAQDEVEPAGKGGVRVAVP